MTKFLNIHIYIQLLYINKENDNTLYILYCYDVSVTFTKDLII